MLKLINKQGISLQGNFGLLTHAVIGYAHVAVLYRPPPQALFLLKEKREISGFSRMNVNMGSLETSVQPNWGRFRSNCVSQAGVNFPLLSYKQMTADKAGIILCEH